MTNTEVMQMALDWFKCYQDKSMSRNNAEELADEVITALRQALEPHERYFCERCGKRLFDGIHTCTPPADNKPVEWAIHELHSRYAVPTPAPHPNKKEIT